jgi:hypothetical protein
LTGEENFEDIDDFAFDSPVLCRQLLEERTDDLVFKDIFG